MQKRTLTLAGMAAIATTAFVAPAMAEMNYNSLEANYLSTDIDDGLDLDGDGFGVGGSVELGDTFFLHANVAQQDFDTVDIDQWQIGFGAHTPLSDTVDLVGTLSYVDAKASAGSISLDDDGYGAGLGFRSRVADNVELEGGINYVDLDDSGSDTSFAVGGRYYFSDDVSIGIGADIGDEVTTWGATFRLEF